MPTSVDYTIDLPRLQAGTLSDKVKTEDRLFYKTTYSITKRQSRESIDNTLAIKCMYDCSESVKQRGCSIQMA